MKSSSMQRRIGTGAVDGGFRVVAHIRRGAGANQVLYNSTGGRMLKATPSDLPNNRSPSRFRPCYLRGISLP
jgi:hypothetical protein